MTLTQMMIAVGIGSVVLATAATVFVTSSFSFTAMGNYIAMDENSRNALDQMTRDIRRSQNLTSFTTNQLVLNFSGSTNLVYNYDPVGQTLTSWKTGDAQTNTLLAGCNYLKFSVYASVPQPGGVLTNTTIVSKAKAISVNWRCSRSAVKRVNTEFIQESLIVIRSKPVS